MFESKIIGKDVVFKNNLQDVDVVLLTPDTIDDYAKIIIIGSNNK